MHSSHSQFRKADSVMESEINNILNAMTLEEKIQLLGGAKGDSGEDGNTRSCKRLGIPSLRMADASVGVHWWIEDTTTFPASIGLAASFNTWLAEKYAAAIARDCLAGGIHILLGPGLNLYRSALCGRNFEYFGEDPFLASRMAVSYIQSLQAQGVCATLKHYAVNNQEFDRNKVSSDLDERTLREVYLQAFEAGVKEGGAGAIMTGYNLVNGLHCAEHGHLIKKVLKGDWGFEGIVMSDWVSVYDAINSAVAGLDLEMPFAVWLNQENLLPAVQNGRLSEKVIDDKVRRLLRLAKSFGWIGREQKIDDPGRNLENASIALEVARESIVLLKNENILPLDFTKIKHIAVLGPSSDPAVVGGGGSGYNKGWRTISFLDGISALAPENLTISHGRGINADIAFEAYQQSNFDSIDPQGAIKLEFFNTNDLTGPVVLTRFDSSINNLWRDSPIAPEVEKKHFSIRFSGQFTLEQASHVDFYLHVWDGAIRLKVDQNTLHDTWDCEAFGDFTLCSKLNAGVHEFILEFRNIRNWNAVCFGFDAKGRKDAEYQKALALAANADLVVFCGGFDHRSEAEGRDRSFAIPKRTEQLLLDVCAKNSRIVLVLTAGGNVDMSLWHDKVAAIIHTWYPGQEGGTALAEIISGNVNPSGRLPATFEYHLEDRSSFDNYHDHDHDFRVTITDGVFGGYRHFDKTGIKPRYPFGFGLSYTTFAYQNLILSQTSLSFADPNTSLLVSFDVMNTGKCLGAEVSQLYLGAINSLVPRPIKELKGFAKNVLRPGERIRISLSLQARDFCWYDVDSEMWKLDAGSYRIDIATSSEDLRLTQFVEINASLVIDP